MRLLLDTHAVVWWLNGDNRISALLERAIADATVLVSAATAWEIATKVRINKLALRDGLSSYAASVEDHGFLELPVSQKHGIMAGSFPAPHRDPFDRMLAAQSIVESVPIVSIDEKLDAFGCERIWT